MRRAGKSEFDVTPVVNQAVTTPTTAASSSRMRHADPQGPLRVRVLALDYGAARTGVAVSDASGTLARPVCVVRKAATENGLAEVVRLVDRARGRAGRRRPASDAAGRARQAGRRDGAVRDCAARARRRCRSRRPTSASRPRSRSASAARRPRTLPRRPTCSRAGSTARLGREARRGPRCRRGGGLAARRRLRWEGGDSTEAATTTAPPIANLRIIFPEGLNVREMGERVAAVRQIAIAKRGVTPEADPGAVPRGRRAGEAAEGVSRRLEARLDGGLPLPGALRVHPVHERHRARRRPAGGVPQELRARQPRATRARRT